MEIKHQDTISPPTNIKIAVIPTVIGPISTVTKGLVQGIEDL